MAKIELRGITHRTVGRDRTLKAFSPDNVPDSEFLISDLNLVVPDGKTLAVIGPSGCGKTTVLRIIAGLVTPDRGGVFFNDTDLTRKPPKERRIGMVFQNYALYPHLKNRANVLSFFLFRKKSPELDREAEEKLKYTAEVLGVEVSSLLDRNPSSLSGGEKQRIALGRCITRDPAVFLLDEPFSNLDAALRVKYRVELKKLLVRFGVTAVYVTHDQSEAFLLGDLIAVMKDGKILQMGTYKELYDNPCCRFVAEFMNPEPEIAALNIVDAALIQEGASDSQCAGFRPVDVEIKSGSNAIQGLINEVRPSIGKNQMILRVAVKGNNVCLRVPSGSYSSGQNLEFRPVRYFLFDKKSGERQDLL